MGSAVAAGGSPATPAGAQSPSPQAPASPPPALMGADTSAGGCPTRRLPHRHGARRGSVARAGGGPPARLLRRRELTPVQTPGAASLGWSRHLCRRAHACTHIRTVCAHARSCPPGTGDGAGAPLPLATPAGRQPPPCAHIAQPAGSRHGPGMHQPGRAPASPAVPWQRWGCRAAGRLAASPHSTGGGRGAGGEPPAGSSCLLPPRCGHSRGLHQAEISGSCGRGRCINHRAGSAAVPGRLGPQPPPPSPGRGLFEDRSGCGIPTDSEHPPGRRWPGRARARPRAAGGRGCTLTLRRGTQPPPHPFLGHPWAVGSHVSRQGIPTPGGEQGSFGAPQPCPACARLPQPSLAGRGNETPAGERSPPGPGTAPLPELGNA